MTNDTLIDYEYEFADEEITVVTAHRWVGPTAEALLAQLAESAPSVVIEGNEDITRPMDVKP